MKAHEFFLVVSKTSDAVLAWSDDDYMAQEEMGGQGRRLEFESWERAFVALFRNGLQDTARIVQVREEFLDVPQPRLDAFLIAPEGSFIVDNHNEEQRKDWPLLYVTSEDSPEDKIVVMGGRALDLNFEAKREHGDRKLYPARDAKALPSTF